MRSGADWAILEYWALRVSGHERTGEKRGGWREMEMYGKGEVEGWRASTLIGRLLTRAGSIAPFPPYPS